MTRVNKEARALRIGRFVMAAELAKEAVAKMVGLADCLDVRDAEHVSYLLARVTACEQTAWDKIEEERRKR